MNELIKKIYIENIYSVCIFIIIYSYWIYSTDYFYYGYIHSNITIHQLILLVNLYAITLTGVLFIVYYMTNAKLIDKLNKLNNIHNEDVIDNV